MCIRDSANHDAGLHAVLDDVLDRAEDGRIVDLVQVGDVVVATIGAHAVSYTHLDCRTETVGHAAHGRPPTRVHRAGPPKDVYKRQALMLFVLPVHSKAFSSFRHSVMPCPCFMPSMSRSKCACACLSMSAR